MVHNFFGIAEVGSPHFQNIYKEPMEANIAKIMNIASYFPSFVTEQITKC